MVRAAHYGRTLRAGAASCQSRRGTCDNPGMRIASHVLVALVAALHLYFLVLEMFLWTRPAGLRAFGQTREQAEGSRVLAANQGLYNGFLAAGLVWSLLAPPALAQPLRLFFLTCVIVAGVYGGVTASRKILFVQALPALLALALVWA
jgi:putative membrane protein